MIETPRLRIGPLPAGERDALFAQWVDPANERLGSAGEPPSDEQVRRWMEGAWAVWERDTGSLVGDCTLFYAEEHDEWELAYGFRRDRWGLGYASEAGAALVRYGFDELGLKRIVADVDPANVGSVRVLEKLGFEHVGGGGDKLLYELTRETSR